MKIERVYKVKLNRGGYDRSGTYYGTGAPLYRAVNEDGRRYEFRARSRAEAVRMAKNAGNGQFRGFGEIKRPAGIKPWHWNVMRRRTMKLPMKAEITRVVGGGSFKNGRLEFRAQVCINARTDESGFRVQTRRGTKHARCGRGEGSTPTRALNEALRKLTAQTK